MVVEQIGDEWLTHLRKLCQFLHRQITILSLAVFNLTSKIIIHMLFHYYTSYAPLMQ